MAAIQCYEAEARRGAVRPMRILSFENDLDSLRLAFRHSDKFTYLRHSGPAWLLREGRWDSKEFPGLSWELLEGDFVRNLDAAPVPPEIIFYDMFSSKTCGDQWTVELFQRLFAACKGCGTELFTYSCSTATRVAMLAAGFHVARGRCSGEKEETTIAFTPEAWAGGYPARHEVLGKEWLARWQRSAARFPAGLPEAERIPFAERILGHPQFKREAGA
jgi:queuine tRNA-ribosyltransferase